MYTPPFTISAKAINLIAEISAQLERYVIRMEQADGIRLRKVNRMKTIHGTLAIEGNTLTEEQVTALLNGKHVVAPAKEVQEVRNAITAYDSFMDFNPYNYKDLLKAHGLMAMGLVDNSGHFRTEPVGVLGKEGIAHVAPPADRVPLLISDLFEWLNNSQDHVLIKSSVFHYEFEFIHPFMDGNGRMGRFWQSRLLSEWNPVFAHLPVENMIWENQAEYYKAIQNSTDANDSGIFVDFILAIIFEALKSHRQSSTESEKVTVKVTQKVTVNQQKILDAIKKNPHITQEELSAIVGIARKNIIANMKKLQEAGLLIRHGADKNGWWEVTES